MYFLTKLKISILHKIIVDITQKVIKNRKKLTKWHLNQEHKILIFENNTLLSSLKGFTKFTLFSLFFLPANNTKSMFLRLLSHL